MAGRAHARHPDDHVRYDAPVEPGAVIKHDGELVFKRRRDEGGYRIYVSINAEARIPPITVPTDEAPDEYPVVGVITKPRRRSSRRE